MTAVLNIGVGPAASLTHSQVHSATQITMEGQAKFEWVALWPHEWATLWPDTQGLRHLNLGWPPLHHNRVSSTGQIWISCIVTWHTGLQCPLALFDADIDKYCPDNFVGIKVHAFTRFPSLCTISLLILLSDLCKVASPLLESIY